MSEWVYGVYAVRKREHRGSSLHVRWGVQVQAFGFSLGFRVQALGFRVACAQNAHACWSFAHCLCTCV